VARRSHGLRHSMISIQRVRFLWPDRFFQGPVHPPRANVEGRRRPSLQQRALVGRNIAPDAWAPLGASTLWVEFTRSIPMPAFHAPSSATDAVDSGPLLQQRPACTVFRDRLFTAQWCSAPRSHVPHARLALLVQLCCIFTRAKSSPGPTTENDKLWRRPGWCC
jgi:hypothetical protein